MGRVLSPRLIHRGELLRVPRSCGGSQGNAHLGPRGQREDLTVAGLGGWARPGIPAGGHPGAAPAAGLPAVLARRPRGLRRAPGAPGEGGQPAATPGFNLGAIAERVRSELAGQPDRTFLVIDDLHELASQEALTQLTRLLEKLPRTCTRSSRRGATCRCDCTSFGWPASWPRSARADLRFTQEETREFLEASGVTLSEDRAAKLHQRTEGWAAGLRLAAMSLAGSPDPERFVAEFSGSSRTVAEYLLAEMLECQPAEVQQLLLRTSLLDRVSGELADLLTGHTGSARILLDLEDANAFVVSLDPARTWFRYHHLFADLLRLELRRTLSEQAAALHRLAAAWFSEHGEIVDAIRHTQAAGDWPDAARLLADHSFGLTLDGQAQTIQSLLRAFPAWRRHRGPGSPAGARHQRSCPGTPGRGGRPPDVAEASIAIDAARPQAPPRSGDRGAETVPGAEARTFRGGSRAGQVPRLAGNRGNPTRTSRSTATCARWRS